MKVIVAKKDRTEKGSIMLLFVFSVVGLFLFLSLVIDIGFGTFNKRKLQYATDAAVYAAAWQLQSGVTQAQLAAVAENYGIINGLTSQEIINGGGTDFGRWDLDANEKRFFNSGASPINAIRFRAKRSSPTFFKIFSNSNSIEVSTESIAAYATADKVDCALPFGIEQSQLAGRTMNVPFTLTGGTSGNWRKIQIGNDQLSGAKKAINAIVNGVCGERLSIGDQVSPATGVAGFKDGFLCRTGDLSSCDRSQPEYDTSPGEKVIGQVAIIDEWPPGGSADVTITQFVAIEVISVAGSGANLELTLKLIDAPIGNGGGEPVDGGEIFGKRPVLVL